MQMQKYRASGSIHNHIQVGCVERKRMSIQVTIIVVVAVGVTNKMKKY